MKVIFNSFWKGELKHFLKQILDDKHIKIKFVEDLDYEIASSAIFLVCSKKFKVGHTDFFILGLYQHVL